MKLNKTTFILGILILFFVMISSASSASFYVNQNTTHDNIMDWIDNKAVKGDKLIFNTDNYNLTDTIVINKPIYVGSYKNTKIIMKSNTSMFDINTTAVNFIGLNLINNGKTVYYEDGGAQVSCAIKGITENFKFNMKNTNITASVGLYIYKINGNIYNSKLTTQLTSIITSYWKGHLINSEIKSKSEGIDAYKIDIHWYSELKWAGNIIKSTITSQRSAINCGYQKGIISGSKIYSYGKTIKTPTISFSQGKIQLSKTIVKSNSYTAILGKKYKTKIKNYKSKLIPKKGYPKYYLKK